jgi:hypothetical protein
MFLSSWQDWSGLGILRHVAKGKGWALGKEGTYGRAEEADETRVRGRADWVSVLNINCFNSRSILILVRQRIFWPGMWSYSDFFWLKLFFLFQINKHLIFFIRLGDKRNWTDPEYVWQLGISYLQLEFNVHTCCLTNHTHNGAISVLRRRWKSTFLLNI